MKIKSQSAVEYAVLIAVLVAAIAGMNLYVRRSVNANLKGTEEQINALDAAGAWDFQVSSGGDGGDGGPGDHGDDHDPLPQ